MSTVNPQAPQEEPRSMELAKGVKGKREMGALEVSTGQDAFGSGLSVVRLLGTTMRDVGLCFLVEFDGNRIELIPSQVINAKEPQKVIKFYEQRLVWRPKAKK